jgi:hypothetical protein
MDGRESPCPRQSFAHPSTFLVGQVLTHVQISVCPPGAFNTTAWNVEPVGQLSAPPPGPAGPDGPVAPAGPDGPVGPSCPVPTFIVVVFVGACVLELVIATAPRAPEVPASPTAAAMYRTDGLGIFIGFHPFLFGVYFRD